MPRIHRQRVGCKKKKTYFLCCVHTVPAAAAAAAELVYQRCFTAEKENRVVSAHLQSSSPREPLLCASHSSYLPGAALHLARGVNVPVGTHGANQCPVAEVDCFAFWVHAFKGLIQKAVTIG